MHNQSTSLGPKNYIQTPYDASSDSVAVITSLSHSEGPRFDPGFEQFLLLCAYWACKLTFYFLLMWAGWQLESLHCKL